MARLADVRDLVGQCTCPVQFPMVKIGEGKYRIGNSNTLIFVRVLRQHVMVRVGGGWDTLENYLDKHDPCRCLYKGSTTTTSTTTPPPSSLRVPIPERASRTSRPSPSCSNTPVSASFHNSSIPGPTSSSNPKQRRSQVYTPRPRASPLKGRSPVERQQSSACREAERRVIVTPPPASPSTLRRKLQQQKSSDVDTQVLMISGNNKDQHSGQVQSTQEFPASPDRRRRKGLSVSFADQPLTQTPRPRRPRGPNFQPRSILKKRDPPIPPEDPEMYKKLQILFEEYRQMEHVTETDTELLSRCQDKTWTGLSSVSNKNVPPRRNTCIFHQTTQKCTRRWRCCLKFIVTWN